VDHPHPAPVGKRDEEGSLSSDWYVLDEQHNVVGPVDVIEAAKFRKDMSRRRVALTKVYEGCEVSTVFLGLDHRYTDEGAPLVFESLVMGGPFADDMERYSTWAEAEAGHARIVDKCQPILTEELP
jgi:hypothetical protein